MVRSPDATVHPAMGSLQGRAEQDMVNAEIELVPVVGDSQATTSLREGVFQPLPDDAVRVGDGRVVEVAAHHDVAMGGTVYLPGNGIGLGSPDGGSLCQLAGQQAGAALHLRTLRIAQHVLVDHFVLVGQLVGLQVIIEEQQGILSPRQFVNPRAVGGTGILQRTGRQDGPFGIAGDAVGPVLPHGPHVVVRIVGQGLLQ